MPTTKDQYRSVGQGPDIGGLTLMKPQPRILHHLDTSKIDGLDDGIDCLVYVAAYTHTSGWRYAVHTPHSHFTLTQGQWRAIKPHLQEVEATRMQSVMIDMALDGELNAAAENEDVGPLSLLMRRINANETAKQYA